MEVLVSVIHKPTIDKTVTPCSAGLGNHVLPKYPNEPHTKSQLATWKQHSGNDPVHVILKVYIVIMNTKYFKRMLQRVSVTQSFWHIMSLHAWQEKQFEYLYLNLKITLFPD